MEKTKIVERSVDSLQRIYSFVLALSLGQAITIVVLDNSTKQLLPLTLDRIMGDEGIKFFQNVLPIALGFFVTLIPFHQGMNRHLDVQYLENPDSNSKRGLLLDFFFFMFEGGAFFAIASSIRQQTQAYIFFALLLLLDIIWALLAKLVHRTKKDRPLAKWPGINFATLVVGFLILGLNFVGPEWKAWLLLMILTCRTIVDYKTSWKFYFPFDEETEATD
jgi:hypothetical protein